MFFSNDRYLAVEKLQTVSYDKIDSIFVHELNHLLNF